MTDWQLVVDSFWPLLVGGLTGTIPLAVVSFAIGLVIAFILVMDEPFRGEASIASHPIASVFEDEKPL